MEEFIYNFGVDKYTLEIIMNYKKDMEYNDEINKHIDNNEKILIKLLDSSFKVQHQEPKNRYSEEWKVWLNTWTALTKLAEGFAYMVQELPKKLK
jgi:hypothetical protein